jgi:hypothetical protein
MSDVPPSIIVLAITALLVFRRELTTPRAKKAPRGQAPQDAAKRAKLPGEIADARRHAPPPPLVLSTAARPS